MNILIVEDDEFKFSEIEALVLSVLDEVHIFRTVNVRDTIVYLAQSIPDKILLDMSLPSHTPKVGEGNPLAMPAGGIEVILELRSIGKNSIPIIILTQYPDIEIENEYFSIPEAGKKISDLYDIPNISATYYLAESGDWIIDTTAFLES